MCCATLAWFVNNLSQTFTNNTFFELNYINTPKDVILAKKPKDKIQVRLKSVGFQLLAFGLQPKQIYLDLSKVIEKEGDYQLTTDQIRIQIESQLASNSVLIDFEKDPIIFDFTSLKTKKVKVAALIELSYSNNFTLNNKLLISPDSIEITGPKSMLDTIKNVYTNTVKLANLSEDFSISSPLRLPKLSENFKVSHENVKISGTVVKFGERLIKVPISVINLPEGVKMRTFPETTEVRIQGTLDKIKKADANEFKVIADYKLVSTHGGNRIAISLAQYPDYLIDVSIAINEVEFILRRE